MRLLYFLLLSVSVLFSAEYVDLEEFLNPTVEPISTLNNLPHDIKMLIAEKIDIIDIPQLIQTTPALYRFIKTYLNQKYLDSKEVTEIKALSYAQLNSDLNSPSKVVKLLKLLNRLHKYKYDMSFINAEQIALECSKVRFYPTFCILGGTKELDKFFLNYCESRNYAPVSILSSIRKDKFVLPIVFAILASVFYYHEIPYIISQYKTSNILKEKFSHLSGLSSDQLPEHYSQDEINIIYKCKSSLKCTFAYCKEVEAGSSCDAPEYRGCIPPNEIQILWTNIINRHDFSHPNHNPYFDEFESFGVNVIKFAYNDGQWYSIGSEKPYWVYAGYYIIKEACLIGTNNINLSICLATIIPGLILIVLLIDKIYLASKKKNRADLNIQNIYRNL